MSVELIRKKIGEHIVLIICLFFAVIASIVGKTSLFDLAKFIVVQIGFVYVPGYSLQRLVGVSCPNRLSRYFISYATGYAISIIVYIVLLILGCHRIVLAIYLGIALVSALCLFKRRKVFSEPYQIKEHYGIGIILSVVFVLGFIFFQCVNISPMHVDGDVLLNHDLIFWFRNNIAATKTYPLPDLSVVGRPLFYHYFSSLELAFLALTTGIEMFDLTFTYYWLVYLFLFVGGVYVLMQEISNRKDMIYLALCLILFACSMEKYTHVYFIAHVYKVSFGAVEGLAFLCFTLYFFFRYEKSLNSKSSLPLLFFSLLMFFVCVGAKGPFAAMLLVGLCVGCLMVVFKQKKKKALWTGMAFILVFLLVCALFVFGFVFVTIEEGYMSTMSISKVNTLYHSGVFHLICNKIESITGIYYLAWTISILLFICMSMCIPILAILISYFLERNVGWRFCDIVLGSIAVIGVFFCLFITQSGMSQMYFAFPAIMATLMIACSRLSINTPHVKLLWCVFGAGFVLFCLQYGREGKSNLILAERNRCSSIEGQSNKLTEESGLTITKEEMEGLRWMRDVLNKNAIVLSNKVLAHRGGVSFLVSSLSERQAFFESYDYSNQSNIVVDNNLQIIQGFYTGFLESLMVLKDKGVTHAVVFKRVNANSFPGGCEVVFENEDMIVVQL